MTREISLFAILQVGDRIEKSEHRRKFFLAVEKLNIPSEYLLETGEHFLSLVAGSIELGIEPYIIYGSFYCGEGDPAGSHITDSALVIENHKLCPRHPIFPVVNEHEHVVLLRSQLED